MKEYVAARSVVLEQEGACETLLMFFEQLVNSSSSRLPYFGYCLGIFSYFVQRPLLDSLAIKMT